MFHCLINVIHEQNINKLLPYKTLFITSTYNCVVAANGRTDILRLLLAQEGAYEAVRYRDIRGGSPAHDAAQQGRLGCLRLLVEAGLDMHHKDEVGKSGQYVVNVK